MSKTPQYKMLANVVHDGVKLPKDSICPENLGELMASKGLAEKTEPLVQKGPPKMKGDLDGDGDVDADDAALAEARKNESNPPKDEAAVIDEPQVEAEAEIEDVADEEIVEDGKNKKNKQNKNRR